MTININPALEELPPEAKEVAESAYNKIDIWIDKKVNALRKETKTAIEVSVRELKSEINAVEKSFEESRKELESIITKFEELSFDLDAGDGKTVTEAIASTKELAKQLQTELKLREQKWKGIGEKMVNKAVSAGTSILGIPPGIV